MQEIPSYIHPTIEGTAIEIVNQFTPHSRELGDLLVGFDVDGTLTLLRKFWADWQLSTIHAYAIAAGMPDKIAGKDILDVIRENVQILTGHPTLRQCQWASEWIEQHTGTRYDPFQIKRAYTGMLERAVDERKAEIARTGDASPFLVPYVHEYLGEWNARGAYFFAASGTDRDPVIDDLKVVGLYPQFLQFVEGADDKNPKWGKEDSFRKALDEKLGGRDGRPGTLVVGGDSWIEQELANNIAGDYPNVNVIKVGVVAELPNSFGILSAGFNRSRIEEHNPHILVPDYRDYKAIVQLIMGERNL